MPGARISGPEAASSLFGADGAGISGPEAASSLFGADGAGGAGVRLPDLEFNSGSAEVVSAALGGATIGAACRNLRPDAEQLLILWAKPGLLGLPTAVDTPELGVDEGS